LNSEKSGEKGGEGVVIKTKGSEKETKTKKERPFSHLYTIIKCATTQNFMLNNRYARVNL